MSPLDTKLMISWTDYVTCALHEGFSGMFSYKGGPDITIFFEIPEPELRSNPKLIRIEISTFDRLERDVFYTELGWLRRFIQERMTYAISRIGLGSDIIRKLVEKYEELISNEGDEANNTRKATLCLRHCILSKILSELVPTPSSIAIATYYNDMEHTLVLNELAPIGCNAEDVTST